MEEAVVDAFEEVEEEVVEAVVEAGRTEARGAVA